MSTSAITPINPDVIEQQLVRILSSSQFVATTRLNRFLRYLVEQSLAGNADALKGYTIGVDVFDRPEGFDPALDTIVRVQAGKLRSRLDLYYAHEGKDDPIRIIVPKGSYRPQFEVAFNPKPSQSAEVSETDEVQTTRYSIAVLPFDNLSGDPNQEYLADGFTEQVINALTRFREFQVISRQSTFRYKDRPADPRDIGSELGVRYTVEGSVRRWEDQLRVTAQLIDAETGAHLSSEVFDRTLGAKGLFEIEEEVAAHIAAQIAEPHGVIHRRRRHQRISTEKLDAHECRLLASEYWRSPNEESHSRVRDLLERAVAIEPSHAGAWAMLSIVYADELRGNYNLQPEPLERALAAAERAVETDPQEVAGFHALFMVHFHRGEFVRFRAAADTAFRINPNYPDMLADLAALTAYSGDWAKAIEILDRAIQLSPSPPGWYHWILTFYHCLQGEFETALTHARRAGNSIWGGEILFEAMILGHLGKSEEARPLVREIEQNSERYAKFIRRNFELYHLPDDLRAIMREGWRKGGITVDLESIS
ncbi:MAG: adenylate cyclase [Parasphingorhabdus sp.]